MKAHELVSRLLKLTEAYGNQEVDILQSDLEVERPTDVIRDEDGRFLILVADGPLSAAPPIDDAEENPRWEGIRR